MEMPGGRTLSHFPSAPATKSSCTPPSPDWAAVVAMASPVPPRAIASPNRKNSFPSCSKE